MGVVDRPDPAVGRRRGRETAPIDERVSRIRTDGACIQVGGHGSSRSARTRLSVLPPSRGEATAARSQILPSPAMKVRRGRSFADEREVDAFEPECDNGSVIVLMRGSLASAAAFALAPR